MNQKMRSIWLSVLLIIVVAVTVAGCTPKAQETVSQPGQDPAAPAAVKTGPFKGMQAPDFVLKDLAGTAWTLSELKGSSVALIFFTSW